MKSMKFFRSVICLILTLVLCFAMTVNALAAKNKDGDSSTTHLFYGDNGEKAPFTKQNIVLVINGVEYAFNEKGNNSWTIGNGALGELNIGNDESIDVIIKVGGKWYLDINSGLGI